MSDPSASMQLLAWKYFEFEQCPQCGDDLEVRNGTPEGIVTDGDEIRCVECSFKSGVSVDDEEVWVQDVNAG